MAHEAPWSSAAATKPCPSRLRPRNARKASPGAKLRLSIEMPLTSVRHQPDLLPRVALAISPTVHSGSATIRLVLQRGANRLMVRIREYLAFDDLARLMAFARDQQDVARPQSGDGLLYRCAAAGNLDRA